MKKFLVSLIYISLATLVMAYLFKVMRWPGLGEVNIGLFWLHIGAYLGYAALVPDKDSRILFPMGFLVFLLILSTAEVGISNSFAIVGLIIIYVGYHIAMSTYLGKSEIPFIQKGGIVGLVLLMIGVVFKEMHWPRPDLFFIIGCGTTSFILLIAGLTKGLVRQK